MKHLITTKQNQQLRWFGECPKKVDITNHKKCDAGQSGREKERGIKKKM